MDSDNNTGEGFGRRHRRSKHRALGRHKRRHLGGQVTLVGRKRKGRKVCVRTAKGRKVCGVRWRKRRR